MSSPVYLYIYELCSFSNLSVTSPTSQLILKPSRCFSYVTASSPTLPLLHLHHSSFSNPSVALPTSQLILQPFRYFTYVTAHFTTLPSLYLRQRLILQPFRCFSYVTAHSSTLPSLHLCHRHFTYVTWRAAHALISFFQYTSTDTLSST